MSELGINICSQIQQQHSQQASALPYSSTPPRPYCTTPLEKIVALSGVMRY